MQCICTRLYVFHSVFSIEYTTIKIILKFNIKNEIQIPIQTIVRVNTNHLRDVTVGFMCQLLVEIHVEMIALILHSNLQKSCV